MILDNYICNMGMKLTALAWVAAAVGGILIAETIEWVLQGSDG